MRSLDYFFTKAKALRIASLLANHRDFLAHLPGEGFEGKIPSETLAKHADKVLEYARRLCKTHHLDRVLNRLIAAAIQSFEEKDLLGNWLKELFVGTIAFHDFGKINPHFQLEKMKNRLFQGKHPELMKPKQGHSALGAYIFLSYYLEKIKALPRLNSNERKWLITATILFADSIIEHHSPRIRKPDVRLRKAIFEQPWKKWTIFLQQYQFQEAQLLAALEKPGMLEIFYDSISEEDNFPLFALVRLNFSLLTGADNLATSDYMKQGVVDDFGLIDSEMRALILKNIRRTESYNADAFKKAEDASWKATICVERSAKNLNRLRGQMAVEVIRKIRRIQEESPNQRLFYLEAPTGGGKTNLSMLAASEMLRLNPEVSKIFYVFPFTTLITQTHRSVAKIFGLAEREIGLMHSKAGFRKRESNDEDQDAAYGADWKNDLHLQFAQFPISLLTHVRFFNLLKSQQKQAIYPMHRLADSIVVIDELQSYPPMEWDKMLYFIAQYSRYFNMRFILMSATLPRIDRLDISLQNRLRFVDLLPDARRFFLNNNFRQRVRFRFDLLKESGQTNRKREIELAELADFLIERSRTYAAAHSGRVFTMVEFIFKKSATEFKIKIEENEEWKAYFDHLFVLSGTILEPRRREIINFLKRKANLKPDEKKPLKVLLITTQVVEAGVDIDMDIGFKNISLIDSDEQLAGRINRNVKKETCDVYLFKVNEPGVLYKSDLRFQITRDKISVDQHRQILEEKDFERLYNEVLPRIDGINALQGVDNFNTQYLRAIRQIDFREIDQRFKLIDSDNISIFVPMELPIFIQGAEVGKIEAVFDQAELDYLFQNGAHTVEQTSVSGDKVWRLYRRFLKAEREMEFFDKRIGKKILQGILAKFTFSIFKSPHIESKLIPFLNTEESLDSYLCLRDDYQEIYDYETGLMEGKLDSAEGRIF